jgi:ElaB/YqjD/DUF883 family membrane-anchored ribosome-binding protein
MSQSNTPHFINTEKLIADVKQMIADADALVRATADQAGEKVSDLRARLEVNLKAAGGQLAEFEARFVNTTAAAVQDALQKASDAANQAADAASEAAQKAEESVKKAAESGKDTARHAAEAARDAAQKAAIATRGAADKALEAVTEVSKKIKDSINR